MTLIEKFLKEEVSFKDRYDAGMHFVDNEKVLNSHNMLALLSDLIEIAKQENEHEIVQEMLLVFTDNFSNNSFRIAAPWGVDKDLIREQLEHEFPEVHFKKFIDRTTELIVKAIEFNRENGSAWNKSGKSIRKNLYKGK